MRDTLRDALSTAPDNQYDSKCTGSSTICRRQNTTAATSTSTNAASSDQVSPPMHEIMFAGSQPQSQRRIIRVRGNQEVAIRRVSKAGGAALSPGPSFSQALVQTPRRGSLGAQAVRFHECVPLLTSAVQMLAVFPIPLVVCLYSDMVGSLLEAVPVTRDRACSSIRVCIGLSAVYAAFHTTSCFMCFFRIACSDLVRIAASKTDIRLSRFRVRCRRLPRRW
jgi:hypothetical protein